MGVRTNTSASLPPTPSPPTPRPIPTLAPTPKPTNPPKPKFNKDDTQWDVSTYTVVSSLVNVTASPTLSPTTPPTPAGYTIVKQKKTFQVAETSLKFPLSVDEASNPVMQEALTTGMANSLGLNPENVKIISINGEPLARSRRRLTDVDIKFQITSDDSDASAVQQLKADLETAATEGSIVANIQKAANEKGVLTTKLQSMKRELDKPVVETKSVQKEVDVIVLKSLATPTATDTATPTAAPTAPAPSAPTPTTPTAPPTKSPVLNGAKRVYASKSVLMMTCCVLMLTWFAEMM